MALFHSVEFLELYRIIPMSMLDRNERLFQDHTFVSHREYVMFQQHQHLLCIRSNQMKSKFPIQIYSPRKFNNRKLKLLSHDSLLRDCRFQLVEYSQ